MAKQKDLSKISFGRYLKDSNIFGIGSTSKKKRNTKDNQKSKNSTSRRRKDAESDSADEFIKYCANHNEDDILMTYPEAEELNLPDDFDLFKEYVVFFTLGDEDYYTAITNFKNAWVIEGSKEDVVKELIDNGVFDKDTLEYYSKVDSEGLLELLRIDSTAFYDKKTQSLYFSNF